MHISDAPNDIGCWPKYAQLKAENDTRPGLRTTTKIGQTWQPVRTSSRNDMSNGHQCKNASHLQIGLCRPTDIHLGTVRSAKKKKKERNKTNAARPTSISPSWGPVAWNSQELRLTVLVEPAIFVGPTISFVDNVIVAAVDNHTAATSCLRAAQFHDAVQLCKSTRLFSPIEMMTLIKLHLERVRVLHRKAWPLPTDPPNGLRRSRNCIH